METKQLLGKRVKRLRQDRGLTQERLAERTNLSVNYLSRIERGLENPTLATMLRLARALKIEPLDLFTVEHELPDHRALRQLLGRLVKEVKDDQVGQVVKVLRSLLR